MPRDARNNPSAVIMRLLAEMQRLFDTIEVLRTNLEAAAPEVYSKTPPNPHTPEFIIQTTYRRVMSKQLIRQREAMRNLRARGVIIEPHKRRAVRKRTTVKEL